VVVAALGCDVGGHEGCEYRSHLMLMVADDVLVGLGESSCRWVVAVHVWVIDGDCMKVKRVELVVCELDDASEERCTVEVVLILERAAKIAYVQVDG
jgi:hypothetical protein